MRRSSKEKHGPPSDTGESEKNPDLEKKGSKTSVMATKTEWCGYNCLRWSIFIFNILFFLCGCTIFVVGLWIAIDRNFLGSVLGTELYATAAYMLVVAGFIIMVISFFGCFGAKTDNRCVMVVYLIILIIILLVIFLGFILAVVFRTQLEAYTKKTMETTLIEYYGEYTAVTDAWNAAQERLDCCAVDYAGWAIYRKSKWISNENEGINDKTPGYNFVPITCCVRDYARNYRNVASCQQSHIMPPGSPPGSNNDAVYYQGCYEAGYRFLKEHAEIMFGLGIVVVVVIIFGIVFAFLFLRMIGKIKDEI